MRSLPAAYDGSFQRAPDLPQEPAVSTAEPTESPRSRWSLLITCSIGFVVVALAIVGYGFTLPDEFRVERSATMAVAPAAVFEHVNDFHKWQAWSPWAKLDPKAKNSFEGPDAGEGAIFRWDGNSDVGTGAMTITGVTPGERIAMRLDFEKPMKDTSMSEFLFAPQGEKTLVTWRMTGQHQNVIAKLMCRVMNVEKMVGDKFEEGLASLGSVAEKQ
jgi:hypothetical protein